MAHHKKNLVSRLRVCSEKQKYKIVFLFSFTKPNYEYLQEKDGIGDLLGLKAKMAEVLDGVDMDKLAKDTQPFLFNPKEIKRVTIFKDFLSSLRN